MIGLVCTLVLQFHRNLVLWLLRSFHLFHRLLHGQPIWTAVEDKFVALDFEHNLSYWYGGFPLSLPDAMDELHGIGAIAKRNT